MTNQEAFDTVYKHLLTQNAKSQDTNAANTCMYRAGDKKCAVGALIPDALYRPSMEGQCVSQLLGKRTVPKHTSDELIEYFWGVDYMLLSRMQYIHDSIPVGDWEKYMRSAASLFGLKVPESFTDFKLEVPDAPKRERECVRIESELAFV